MTDEPKVYERGDIEAELAEADIIIDQQYATESTLHNALEPHGCTAHWHGDQLTLWESTQGIFEVREMVAEGSPAASALRASAACFSRV